MTSPDFKKRHRKINKENLFREIRDLMQELEDTRGKNIACEKCGHKNQKIIVNHRRLVHFLKELLIDYQDKHKETKKITEELAIIYLELDQTMRRLSDFKKTTNVQNREHRRLTESLGSAYLQLQEAMSELKRLNRTLEQKVNDRTRELEGKNIELLSAIKTVQEAEKIKSEFLSVMSHELKTPLNSILGFSKLLLSGIEGSVNLNQKQDLQNIYRSGEHLFELINKVLDYAKLESGRMEIYREECSLDEVIKDAVSISESLIVNKEIGIYVDFDNEVPLVYIDRLRIKQVILNLLSNAIKFTDKGDIRIQVGLEPHTSDESPNVLVSISDTGDGIAPQNQHLIFEAFRQVDSSSTRRAGGTGLGLAIVKKFIEMHGGKIWFDSILKKGTTFYFTLPGARKQPSKMERNIHAAA